MPDSPRSERRREARRAAAGAGASPGPGLVGRRDVLIVLLLAAAIAGFVVGIALFSGGDEDGGASGDQAEIERLARRSVEVLPQGQWPSLYDDFTKAFQERCPRQEFVDAGARNSTELGANLQLLAYKRIEQVSISGDSATAVIVGELRGQSEYTVAAAFERADGGWKLAPASNTEGCQAFTRLSG